MTYSTKVQKVINADGTLFMVKVRLSPDYDGEGAATVHALTEEGAAQQALELAYGSFDSMLTEPEPGLVETLEPETISGVANTDETPDEPDAADFQSDAAQEG